MRLLLLPLELKGTLTAKQAAAVMTRTAKAAHPTVTVTALPMADGGPGTLELLATLPEARRRTIQVKDPLGRRVSARYLQLSKTAALLEMSQASGAWRVADALQPIEASSEGTGELLADAWERGARDLRLCVGGTATSDAGMGALAALGVRFLDRRGWPLRPGGGSLVHLHSVDASGLHPLVKRARLTILVDVQAQLLDAAHLFAPQKGATASQVQQLARGLAQLRRVLRQPDFPGAGAAGGLPYGLAAFCRTRVVPGFSTLARWVGLDQAIRAADLVLTCEGRLDSQTALGKGPAALAQRCRRAGVPIFMLAGQLGAGAPEALFDRVISLSPPGPAPSPRRAARLLAEGVKTALWTV